MEKSMDDKRSEAPVTPAPMTRMQAAVMDERQSTFRKYQDLVIGSRKLFRFFAYECFMTFASGTGGAVGFALRKLLLPTVLGSVGKGTTVGRQITFRHPHRIRLGQQVVIDENCLLDGKGSREVSIEIGDRVFIGRNCILSVHDGYIRIGNHVNIGVNCIVQSGGPILIEDNVIMAAFCHIVSSSRITKRTDIPIIAQGTTRVGIRIGEGTWLGSGVIVVDGVTIGRHCVIGAGAVVVNDIPDYSVAVGIPARVIKSRRDESSP